VNAGTLIGRPVPRLEDERLLRGGSRFVSDLIATSGALRVKILRSAHAHARFVAIDITKARALPGVVDVQAMLERYAALTAVP
jgi:carbon-monoxide dehydrogenase large subunit